MVILYHGTCRASWARAGDGSPLHLTSDRQLAASYARECRENWLLDYKDSEDFDAVVVAFTMVELEALPGARFLPTTGATVLMGILDWRECFAKTQALSIEGFEDKHKAMGRVEKAS